MGNKAKADLLRAIHFAWIIFGLVSFPMIFIFRWWAWVAIIFVLITILSWPILKACYFTKLEEKWRSSYDPNFNFGGKAFIQYYSEKYFGLKFTRQTQRLFGVPIMLLLLGLSVSVILWW